MRVSVSDDEYGPFRLKVGFGNIECRELAGRHILGATAIDGEVVLEWNFGGLLQSVSVLGMDAVAIASMLKAQGIEAIRQTDDLADRVGVTEQAVKTDWG